MTLIFQANLCSRGRQLILQTSGLKRQCISLSCIYSKQPQKPLVQARLYSSEEKTLPSDTRIRLYDGTLNNRMRFVKMFSLFTSVGSIMVQPYLIAKAVEQGSKVTAGAIVGVFGFFAFATPVMLHMITKRYVVHLDYDPVKDTYIATTYSIFVRKKELEFTPEDVKLPDVSEMLTTCFVKGHPMFMDVRLFSDIDHYKRIMGFDKPMDFSFAPETIKSTKNSE